jgi:hypothetical protein
MRAKEARSSGYEDCFTLRHGVPDEKGSRGAGSISRQTVAVQDELSLNPSTRWKAARFFETQSMSLETPSATPISGFQPRSLSSLRMSLM